jgi:hypothetical protein
MIRNDLTSSMRHIQRHYFWFGEVGLAAILAGVFAIPVGIFLAWWAEITIAFIGAAVIFLPHFILLPQRVQKVMKADVDATSKNFWKFFSSSRSGDLSEIEAFGKNEQVKKVFWSLFAAVAGIVLAQVRPAFDFPGGCLLDVCQIYKHPATFFRVPISRRRLTNSSFLANN